MGIFHRLSHFELGTLCGGHRVTSWTGLRGEMEDIRQISGEAACTKSVQRCPGGRVPSLGSQEVAWEMLSPTRASCQTKTQDELL